jgi:transcriptional regulator with XRE-family HTH domain
MKKYLDMGYGIMYKTNMDIKAYYKLTGMNDRKLAELCKLPVATIWRIRNGKHTPWAKTAKIIEKATDGAIKASELLGV